MGSGKATICLIDRSMFIEGWLVDPVIDESINPMLDGKQLKDTAPRPSTEWNLLMTKYIQK